MRLGTFGIVLGAAAATWVPAACAQPPQAAAKEKQAIAALTKHRAVIRQVLDLRGAKGMPVNARSLPGADIDVRSGDLTDADLKWLGDIPGLVHLTLHSDKITDDGLQTIAQLDGLVVLDLRSDKITDRGVKHLAKLKRLYQLALFCPAITDASIDLFRSMSNLKELAVVHRKISDDAIARLTKQRPKLSVRFEPFNDLIHGKVQRLAVDAKDDVITRLTKQRFNAALDLFQHSRARIEAGLMLPDSSLADDVRRVVDAVLDLGDVPQKAIVLQGSLLALRRVRDILDAQMSAGMNGTETYATGMFECRELELRILRAQQGKPVGK